MKKFSLGFFLFFIFLFLSFNKHSKDNYQNYHSVIWADAAGYYVYNPIWFIYGNNFQNFPSDIISKTGNGFSFDGKTGRVATKYTSGVAILQIPFFLGAHFLSGMFGFPSDGFSMIYYWGIMIAACFYGLLGLVFSYLFLHRRFSKFHSLLTVSIFFLATNLYYYIIDASGMLHVYSFFLISLIAYMTSRVSEHPRLKNFLFLFIPLTLAVLIRPTNIILVLFVLFFSTNQSNIFQRKLIFAKEHFVPIIIAFIFSIVIFIPQFIYWKQC